MKILARTPRLLLVYFESKEEDFRLFQDVFLDDLNALNDPFNPLFLDDLMAKEKILLKQFLIAVKRKGVRRVRIIKRGRRRKWIGTIAFEPLRSKDGRPGACVSFFLHKKWRKQGLGLESMGALMEVGRRHLKLSYLTAGVNPSNKSSLKIFQKLGFKNHGIAARKRSGWAGKGNVFFKVDLKKVGT
jgi:RimJ/RimL family protein N-acetyltransferase